MSRNNGDFDEDLAAPIAEPVPAPPSSGDDDEDNVAWGCFVGGLISAAIVIGAWLVAMFIWGGK